MIYGCAHGDANFVKVPMIPMRLTVTQAAVEKNWISNMIIDPWLNLKLGAILLQLKKEFQRMGSACEELPLLKNLAKYGRRLIQWEKQEKRRTALQEQCLKQAEAAETSEEKSVLGYCAFFCLLSVFSESEDSLIKIKQVWFVPSSCY